MTDTTATEEEVLRERMRDASRTTRILMDEMHREDARVDRLLKTRDAVVEAAVAWTKAEDLDFLIKDEEKQIFELVDALHAAVRAYLEAKGSA